MKRTRMDVVGDYPAFSFECDGIGMLVFDGTGKRLGWLNIIGMASLYEELQRRRSEFESCLGSEFNAWHEVVPPLGLSNRDLARNERET